MSIIEIRLDMSEVTRDTTTYLRALADAIDPQSSPPSDPPTEPAAPQRFVEVIDRTGDHGIRDNERGRVADFLTGRSGSAEPARIAHMRYSLAMLNAGTLRPEDVTYSADEDSGNVAWSLPSDLYPPYTEASA
ncbi:MULTISPECIES: hypothetical protein [unclassified Microbacterium]|uniref:hypothetical protein n=1 Tax=unclassified Microbacterium TaxID=2609290 RepID=UPI003015E53E